MVVPVELLVVKRVTPTTFVEPGGIATYTVEITNTSGTTTVNVDSIDDDLYGDLLDPTNPLVTDNTCLALDGDPIGPNGTVTCTFKALVDGNPGDVVTDTVLACVTQVGVPEPICGDASASVTITDEFVPPTLIKTALSTANCSMQVDATYQVVVQNNSTKDSLTVNTLTDNRFGNITAPHAAGGLRAGREHDLHRPAERRHRRQHHLLVRRSHRQQSVRLQPREHGDGRRDGQRQRAEHALGLGHGDRVDHAVGGPRHERARRRLG
ncbi:hypothetical protein OV079_47935 [Nannocystis pusilla]|uniref:DUF11 domain-containing protein n=1 Tax=Nannocystis pusilla TaxID=889268 RepID=A0A9X3J2X7_9BACT|nr:hypothetical protein [Nannocystis pusilla]MCY1013136.1 hypothetical protein [Nannocystis pusilla]